jgi:hypothetical protein
VQIRVLITSGQEDDERRGPDRSVPACKSQAARAGPTVPNAVVGAQHGCAQPSDPLCAVIFAVVAVSHLLYYQINSNS